VLAIAVGGCGSSRSPGASDGPGDASAERTVAIRREPLWKMLLPAATYETRVEAATLADVDVIAASFGAEGYVLTAALADEAEATSYELFGERETGSSTPFESRVAQASFADVDAKAASLASDGFVLTAVTKTFAGLTLFGVKPAGDSRAYEAKTLLVTGPTLDTAVTSLGFEGFVVTALSWSGTGYRLFAVREAGAAMPLDAKVVQLDGTDFSATVPSLGAQGYVVTAAISNTAEYILVVARPAGQTTTHETRVKGAIGAQLVAESAAFAAAGMIIETIATANRVFTIFGTRAR
jgi:hypothetical protein